ncbi:hypothetical protein LguiA_003504 [Lonicera macranthoides]
MVKTYLVTKLGLSNEAEIEISCMGQKLLHSETLKNGRAGRWVLTAALRVERSGLAVVVMGGGILDLHVNYINIHVSYLNILSRNIDGFSANVENT